eukprot:m.151714 g.151714  ORF g.151714 m.151714 type:complete len:499 (+) comp14257_c0_seq1:116-1612(+)
MIRGALFGAVLLALAVSDSVAIAITATVDLNGPVQLSQTPPMGWMSWELFRCDIDCDVEPTHCVNAALYESMADALVSGQFLKAGYDTIHIDDCWAALNGSRDPVTNELIANSTRFPEGMYAVGSYLHSKGIKFGLYTAESPHTCKGYPGSAGYEQLDANTFADWGVDYLKVDGCNRNKSYYVTGYPAMGKALQESGRAIAYSCSWPAYLGDDETLKPFATLIQIGCNSWRNWHDMQCDWPKLSSIIDHWGDYGNYIRQFAGPGHWNDMDMLLIGNDCITDDEARTQMAIWSINAAPLIMGNDLRNMTDSSKAILLNKDAIAVNQDPLGQQGYRVTPKNDTEVWARNLNDGSVAVGLYNKNGGTATCGWDKVTDGYMETCDPQHEQCFSEKTQAEATQECCNNPDCAGFSFNPSTESGCFKPSLACGFLKSPGFIGLSKTNSSANPGADITVQFDQVGFVGNVTVYDIWKQAVVGVFQNNFTATVPYHGTGFFKLSQA